MDGVYYNQIVTEEVLNAMATDLGATDFNNFTGIEKFGADKLNEITQSLVSEGILISGDMCRCVKTDTGIIIMPGTIVFKSGAKKTISENISIEAANSTVVYALNNIVAGTCTIEVSDAFPTDTTIDYVPLCEISSSGELIDKRSVATAKCKLNFNNGYEITLSGTVNSYTKYSKIGTIDRFVWDSYNYMDLSVSPVGDTGLSTFTNRAFGSNLVNGAIYVRFREDENGDVNVYGMKHDDTSNDQFDVYILFL